MAKDSFDENHMPERLWTVNDVAFYLRLKPATIRRMARDGKFGAIKLGKSWRFMESKILKEYPNLDPISGVS